MVSHLLYEVVPSELLHLRLHPSLGLVAGLGAVQGLPATVLENMAPGGQEALQGVPHLYRLLVVRAVTQELSKTWSKRSCKLVGQELVMAQSARYVRVMLFSPKKKLQEVEPP